MKNVTALDLRGTAVADVVDASANAQLTSLNAEDTYASVKL